jgi:hypothetical protein
VGHEVFISYARRTSADVATALADALTDARVEGFLDTTDIEAGESIPAGVVDALLGARVVVVFAGAIYFSRWYCLREFHLAVAAYNTLMRRGVGKAERALALRPVIVGVPETGAGTRDFERLPADLRTTAWLRP